MNDKILKRIQHEYKDNWSMVKEQLETVTLQHVMAQSPVNLDSTYNAILDLCKGNAQEIGQYIDVAKNDFRDVIYWASIDKSKK